MRRRTLRVGLVVVSLFVMLAIVFAALRSEPPPAAPRLERLGPQNEAAEQETREPLKPVEPQPDPIVTLPVAFGTIASLKDVPPVSFQTSAALNRSEEPELPRLYPAVDRGPDAVAQTWPGTINMPSPIANFDGISLAEQGAQGGIPPDTNGDIGYDPATGKRYYFQWVNFAYQAWDVTNPASPVVVLPRESGNALWQAALPGTQCAINNSGDPIALFDEQAHRWFISQFSIGGGAGNYAPFHQCVAVSQTADPAGGWYVYDYPYRGGSTYFNDYPHFGVWPDATYNAYVMTVHEFNAAGSAYLGQSASAFDRAKLLNGDSTAPLVTFALGTNYAGMLAADLDGPPPASGTPGFFFMTTPTGTLQIWEFKPNWTNPPISIFGVGASHMSNYTLTVAAYTDACSGSCSHVPQLGTSQLLDTVGDRLMHRAAFRVLSGITQTAVLNHTVDVDGSGPPPRTGVRWYEVQRNPALGTWTLNQQSTYAPGSAEYRWMGSIATDRAGDIALGYSTSGSSSFPSIRYTGRLFTDTLSQLPQAEVTMTIGSGAQTGYNRWGDYSMMGVDPQDGCTFWYTQEYNGSTALASWKTRIGSFKFAVCTPVSSGALSGTVRSAGNNNPIAAASVMVIDASGATNSTASAGSGVYRLIGLPIGTYTVTAAAGGYITSTVSGVTIAAGVTRTQDLLLIPLAQADLSLIKTASALTIAPGSLLNFTLSVSNAGPNAIASTVTVTDMLPAGYVLNNATGAGWACSGTATMVCTRTGLNVAAPTSITVTGTAPVTFGPLVNSSAVSAEVFDPSNANNTSAVTVTIVPQTDLVITKTGPAFAAPGATLVYALNVSNNGPLTASNGLTVTDTLPAGTTFIGATGGGWNCAYIAGVVTCTRDTLAPGAAPGISITVTAPLTPGPITNVAQIRSDLIDNAPANNIAQITTNITTVYSIYLPTVLREP